jgi:hypothetical protein
MTRGLTRNFLLEYASNPVALAGTENKDSLGLWSLQGDIQTRRAAIED